MDFSVLRSSGCAMMNSICALDSSWLRRYSSKFRMRDLAHSGISSGFPEVLSPARNSVPDRVAMGLIPKYDAVTCSTLGSE